MTAGTSGTLPWEDRISGWVGLNFSVSIGAGGLLVQATYTVPVATRAALMSHNLVTAVTVPGASVQTGSVLWRITPNGGATTVINKVIQNDTGATIGNWSQGGGIVFLGAGDLVEGVTIGAPLFTFLAEGGALLAEYS